MISDLWTLATGGGSAKPLADYGFDDFDLSRVNQDGAQLSLKFSAESASSIDLSPFPFDQVCTFYRDGEIEFRGRIRDTPDVSEMDKGCGGSITLRDKWADLSETPFTQEWVTLDENGIATIQHPRALFGWRGKEEGSESTLQALQKVIAAANANGTPITLAASMGFQYCPLIEAGNQSCGELIRTILRFHPGAVATIVSGTGGDTLHVIDRAYAATPRLPAKGRPTTALRIKARPDLVKTSVHVFYSTAATHWTEAQAEIDETPALIARQRLAIFRESHPAGASITRHSMVVELPAGQIASPPPPAVPHAVAVTALPLPETGSYDSTAEKFWLNQLGLTKLGLTRDHIRLPRSDEGNILAHRVEFFWAVDDPDDPLGESALSAMRPASVNPSSVPLWRPPDVADLKRYLVSGSLAEWMRVKAAEVVVSCTVGVSKTAVDALDPAEREIFFALAPTIGDVLGWPAYFVRRDVKLLATTAKRKIYRNWAATASYDPAEDLRASIAKAKAEAVIPNLARDLFLARATVPWEGSIQITEEECGSVRYLRNGVLCLDNGRSEWETMRAVIQSETLRGSTGVTDIKFGPPAHLSPQDYAALHAAARRARTERAEAATIIAPATSDDAEESETNWDQAGHGAVFAPAIGPVREVLFDSSGQYSRLWDVDVTGENKIKLKTAGQVRKSADVDNTSLVTITGLDTEWTLSVGKWLVLKLTNTGAVSVSLESEWDGFPFPIITEEDANGFQIWQHTFFPLWKAIAPPDELKPGRHVSVSDSIALVRLAPDADLEIMETHEETPSGKFVDCDTLAVGWGASE